MKSKLVNVDNHGVKYQVLCFRCPGCAEMFDNDGYHMIPVNTTEHSPAWSFNGNLEAPTLSPSILTSKNDPQKCHSYLKDGVFEFLNDSTHSLAGQRVEMPHLRTRT